MKTIPTLVISAYAYLTLSGAALAGTQCGASGASASKNLVDTAVAAGGFATLAKAIHEAGLADAVAAAGRDTISVPTDAAFARLPAGTVDELLNPENKAKLQAVLTSTTWCLATAAPPTSPSSPGQGPSKGRP